MDADLYQLVPLQHVLQDTYGFPVQYKRMHLRVHPQAQATNHVSQFVCDHDGPGGLLIVYYAGHGWANPNSVGRILLSGRFPNNSAEEDWSIEWIDVERTLAKTTSDVLVIFDCCHAGLLCRPAMRGPSRSFHYVAACKADQFTKSWGEESFTRAMIWALEELASSRGFTVTRLVNTLMDYKPFPRHQQQAVNYPSRFGPVEREIWITPTSAKGAASPSRDNATDTKQEEFGPTADILDLRFHFAAHATQKHIEKTALALRDFMGSKTSLHFHRISFVDHTSFIRLSAKRWLDVVQQRRKSGAKEDATPVEQQSAPVNSEAGIQNLQSRLLQLPALWTGKNMSGSTVTTTAVATPASASCSCGKEVFGAKPDIVREGVIYHLSMALRLVIQDWRPAPAWH